MQDLVSNIDYLVFIFLAILILIMAFRVLEAKDMSHAIVFLAMAFVGIAGLYLLLASEFLFAIQMTVYAGGVIVLFLFALMLTRTDEFVIRGNTGGTLTKFLLVFTLFSFIFFNTVGLSLKFNTGSPGVIFNSEQNAIGLIGFSLFNDYIASFVILSFILIVVLIGAIYLIKNEGEPEEILDRTDFLPGGVAYNPSTSNSKQED